MTPPEVQVCADRARVYRSLAALFRPPDPEILCCLRDSWMPELRESLKRLALQPELMRLLDDLDAALHATSHADLLSAYERTFETSGGLRCAPHETAHAPATPQEALVRTFELADVAGFYRAFGLEVVPAKERPDHLATELEFMHLLAIKRALAQLDGNVAGEEICEDAARSFVRDHLSRWYPSFCAKLEEQDVPPLYATAARILAGFLRSEERRLGTLTRTTTSDS